MVWARLRKDLVSQTLEGDRNLLLKSPGTSTSPGRCGWSLPMSGSQQSRRSWRGRRTRNSSENCGSCQNPSGISELFLLAGHHAQQRGGKNHLDCPLGTNTPDSSSLQVGRAAAELQGTCLEASTALLASHHIAEGFGSNTTQRPQRNCVS